MGLFLGELSLISIAVGSVLLGITLDYSLHIFTHYRHKKNIDSIFDDLVQPIMMSATTTSIAFLCLLVLKSKALHELGIFAALSVLFSAIFALIILPHFASKLSAEKKIKETVLDRLASVDQSKFNWLKWPILAISILCLFFVNKVKFEDNMMELNYLSPKLEMAEKKLNTLSSASLKPIILNIEGKNLEEALQNGEEVYPILETLKSKEALHHFTALNYFYPSLAEQEKKLKQWNNFWEQQDKDKVIFELDSIGSELGFKKNSFRDFEKLLNSDLSVSHDHFSFLREMLFDDYISEKSNKTNISSILRIGTLPKESIFKELSNFESITFLDNAFLASHFAKILRSDFSRLAILSLSLSFLILLIFYGRIELAIITFIPIALSWLWTLGLMGLFGFKFNIVNIIITSFIFGLGVDYSIFIMHGLQQEHSYQKKNLASYKISIILSVLTTLTGIGVLIFAKHPALKSISALAIIGIVSVILICWVLEPILFNFLFKTKKGDRPHPITAKNFFQTLWVYAWLVGGCFLMLIIAIVLNLFFFIPLEARKNFFHRVVCFLSGLYVRLSLPFNFKFENPHKEDFKKPAMMIANHQSLIEIPLVLMHKPKSILLTNDKVYNSPLYAAITRFADFYSFSKGSEEIFEALQEKIAKGYSIIVFPEGTRSVDDQVQRFRKGAFFLAQNLELDLIPMYFHGTGNFLGKGNFFGKISPVGLRIGQRIPFTDWATEERSWSNQTKKSLKHYRTYLPSYNNEMESPDFLKNRLFENYIYKGPVLECYMRIKTRSEAYYKFFDDLIPNKAKITDLGCGYGFMDYILMWRSEERTILGIDYDCEKIEIAQNCKAKNERIDFICGKVEEVEIPESDVIIISDVLHYLIPEQQTAVINKAIDQLNEDGMLIIRDGDSDKQGRHWGTKLTEIISTNIGFNKTQNELHFLSASFVQKIAESRNLKFELVDNTKFTSNIVCVLRKK